MGFVGVIHSRSRKMKRDYRMRNNEEPSEPIKKKIIYKQTNK